MNIENLSSRFNSLRGLAHRASLSTQDTSAFRWDLNIATAETVKSLSQSLGFGRPATKQAGITRLVNILEKSQEGSWRR